MPASKSLFYYDFYFNGRFIRRFNTYAQAKKLITWPPCRTYPEKLWEIRTVQKLSTGESAPKIKEFNKCQ